MAIQCQMVVLVPRAHRQAKGEASSGDGREAEAAVVAPRVAVVINQALTRKRSPPVSLLPPTMYNTSGSIGATAASTEAVGAAAALWTAPCPWSTTTWRWTTTWTTAC